MGQSREDLNFVTLELNCFVSKNNDACTKMLNYEYTPTTLKSLASMGCEAKTHAACLRLLQIFEIEAATADAAAKKKALELAAASLAGCTATGETCANLRRLHAKLRAESDPNAADCRLEVYALGSAEEPAITFKATALGRFVDKVECTDQCSLMIGREPKDERKFAQCYFKDQKAEALAAMGFVPPPNCSDNPFDPGENMYFAPCYCQKQTYAALNDMALEHGFVAMATLGSGKRFFKETGYRCGTDFRRFRPDEAKDPACRKNLAAFKTKLNSRADVKKLELNVKNIECAKVQ